jgi:hypothetical protein
MVKSKYDGKLYRDEIAAVQAMLEVETGPCTRAQADHWWEMERNAYEESGGLAGIGPGREMVVKV